MSDDEDGSIVDAALDGPDGKILRKVFFFRARAGNEDRNARLAGEVLIELAKWLEAGEQFDLALDRIS